MARLGAPYRFGPTWTEAEWLTRRRAVDAGEPPWHVAGHAGLLERDAEIARAEPLLEAVVGGNGRGDCLPRSPRDRQDEPAAKPRWSCTSARYTCLQARAGSSSETFRSRSPAGCSQVHSAHGTTPRGLTTAARIGAEVIDPGAEEVGVPASDQALQASIVGLYELTRELIAAEPTLIVIDDAQWADPESLRWVGYLSRRLEGVPALLALAGREDDPDAHQRLFGELFSHPRSWS